MSFVERGQVAEVFEYSIRNRSGLDHVQGALSLVYLQQEESKQVGESHTVQEETLPVLDHEVDKHSDDLRQTQNHEKDNSSIIEERDFSNVAEVGERAREEVEGEEATEKVEDYKFLERDAETR